MAEPIAIRFSDASQEAPLIQQVAADVAKILTPNEEVLYVAAQNNTALTPQKDAVVATSNRLIFLNRHILGRMNFTDLHWQDVANVTVQQKILASLVTANATDGRVVSLDLIDKEQSKRLYAIAQQMEQEWREKRRVRQMEEERARSGGIYMASPQAASAPETAPEDPVQRLARARAMLDQGLISEAEYDTLKAKILSTI